MGSADVKEIEGMCCADCGEFIDIDDSDIDNTIDSLSTIYDMSEEYFGV